MSGRRWDHRQLAAGRFEIRVDGDPSIFVEFDSRVTRPASLIRAITATVATHHGDTHHDPSAPSIDWARYGWDDQTEHDGAVAEIARITNSWRGTDLEQALFAHVNTAKTIAGIPTHHPYTVDEADELDRIVRRAPVVVAQDLQAEGPTAA